ncbi:NAD-dependent epimerase/dehydratase family protein [Salipiger sp.]|uniref:NAD-dependent epimerase/dehydratase family protein n=1 Tax=Salipiger sp. TaxID=2078585 RepID=UPI003A9885F3
MGTVSGAVNGEPSRILITGAGGFIGRAAVAEARAHGLEVVALVRKSVAPDWTGDDGVTVVQADLSEPSSLLPLRRALRGCGAVIHAAAHLGGDGAAIEADTLAATRHLLAALPKEIRLVLVSSIAVYDLSKLAPGDAVTERSPLNRPGHAQDAYAESKLAQEVLCQGALQPLWLMRPGAVWGPGRTWHALNGFWAGPLQVTLASDGALPLVHVKHLARALVSASLTDPQGMTALNVIDDDLPTRTRYVAAHRKAAGWPKAALTVPWTRWLALTRALGRFESRLPGLLREPVLRARIMPLRWPNTALRASLGGSDDAAFEPLLKRTLETET